MTQSILRHSGILSKEDYSHFFIFLVSTGKCFALASVNGYSVLMAFMADLHRRAFLGTVARRVDYIEHDSSCDIWNLVICA